MNTGGLNIAQEAHGAQNVTQIGVQVNNYSVPAPPGGSVPLLATVTLDLGNTQADVHKLIELIAGLTHAGISDIHLTNVRLGSLIVTLLMPIPAAQRLIDLAKTRPELFAAFQITNIAVDMPVFPPGAPGGSGGSPTPIQQIRSLFIRRPLLFVGAPTAAAVVLALALVAALVSIGAQPQPTLTPEMIAIVNTLTPTPPPSMTPTLGPCRVEMNVGEPGFFDGPGADYPYLGRLARGDTVAVIGRTADGGWWQVQYGITGWVRASETTVMGDCSTIPIVAPPPTPTATLTPSDTPTLTLTPTPTRPRPVIIYVPVTIAVTEPLPEPCALMANASTYLLSRTRAVALRELYVSAVSPGDSLYPVGRLADNSWWYVFRQEGSVSALGWIDARLVNITGDCSSVPIYPDPTEPVPCTVTLTEPTWAYDDESGCPLDDSEMLPSGQYRVDGRWRDGSSEPTTWLLVQLNSGGHVWIEGWGLDLGDNCAQVHWIAMPVCARIE